MSPQQRLMGRGAPPTQSKLLRTQPDSVCASSRMDLWPRRFLVYLNARRVAHNDIKAWTKRFTPPVCTLMPDKLPDPAANALNQANFANLSRMLLENQMVSSKAHAMRDRFSMDLPHVQVALAPWSQESPPGAGMMIYPTSSSVSLLVVAVFLIGPFPEFATQQFQSRSSRHLKLIYDTNMTICEFGANRLLELEVVDHATNRSEQAPP